MPETKTHELPALWGKHYQTALLPCLFALVCGHAWVAYNGAPGLFWWGLLLALILAAGWAGLWVWQNAKNPKPSWRLKMTLTLLCFALGASHAQFRGLPGQPLPQLWLKQAYHTVTVTGTLAQTDRFFVLKHAHLKGHSHEPLRLKLANFKPLTAQPGDTITLKGWLRLPNAPLYPGDFDEQRYMQSQGLAAALQRPQILQVVKNTHPSLWVKLQRWVFSQQQQVNSQLTKLLPAPVAAVVGGVVLGDRASPLQPDLRQAFAQTGLIHLLAASGMNVGIVAGFVLLLAGWFNLPRWLGLPLAMGFVALYSLLTGLPPSIQRAATMLELALLLKLINHHLKPLTLLGFSVILILLWQPASVFSLGFQLSVLTTLGLIGMVEPVVQKTPAFLPKPLTGLVLVPLIAQLWASPLLVYVFGTLPLLAVPLNILAVAITTPLTLLGFSGVTLSMVGLPASQWMSHQVLWVAGYLAQALLWLAHWGASQPWAQWAVAQPSVWTVLWLYAGLLVLLIGFNPHWLWVTRWQWRWSSLCFSLALIPVIFSLGFKMLSGPTVQGIPLGSGKAALSIALKSSQPKVIILPARLSYWEGRTLSGWLSHRAVKTLPNVVLRGLPEASEGLSLLLEQHPEAVVWVPHLAEEKTKPWPYKNKYQAFSILNGFNFSEQLRIFLSPAYTAKRHELQKNWPVFIKITPVNQPAQTIYIGTQAQLLSAQPLPFATIYGLEGAGLNASVYWLDTPKKDAIFKNSFTFVNYQNRWVSLKAPL